ncbi:hypothetical protein KC842_00765 [Candidatus Nomurabacteria bacterium]|nr:hypothetical protein [Candidatus Nomurabacteria bacterium]USN95014.1 MAG: hypothetical protein H6791_01115 [Candidatus Nomurabacteria bacterium]
MTQKTSVAAATTKPSIEWHKEIDLGKGMYLKIPPKNNEGLAHGMVINIGTGEPQMVHNQKSAVELIDRMWNCKKITYSEYKACRTAIWESGFPSKE